MARRIPDRPAGDYGVDAIAVPVLLSAGALALLALTIVAIIQSSGVWSYLLYGAGLISFGFSAIMFWYATLLGKFRTWAGLLDSLSLRGDERSLDLGCGRGAVVIATALRLPDGRATGIDLWRSQDQTGNSVRATRRNAELNGVADRISLDTGDMTRLPYPDASFDLVTASISLHNIPSRDGRMRAVLEALRVLRPGGRLVIADFGKTREYVAALRSAGARFTTTPAGLRMQWGLFTPTTIIRAEKSSQP